MKVYVLSFTDGSCGGSLRHVLDGCYGVFSSLEKAQKAALQQIQNDNDVVLDCENDWPRAMFMYFCTKGTWTIERMELDDVGL